MAHGFHDFEILALLLRVFHRNGELVRGILEHKRICRLGVLADILLRALERDRKRFERHGRELKRHGKIFRDTLGIGGQSGRFGLLALGRLRLFRTVPL